MGSCLWATRPRPPDSLPLDEHSIFYGYNDHRLLSLKSFHKDSCTVWSTVIPPLLKNSNRHRFAPPTAILTRQLTRLKDKTEKGSLNSLFCPCSLLVWPASCLFFLFVLTGPPADYISCIPPRSAPLPILSSHPSIPHFTLYVIWRHWLDNDFCNLGWLSSPS